MTCYIVTFETSSEVSRQKISDLLKTYSSYCPIHNYCWAIITDKKAMDILNHLSSAINTSQNERMFVIKSGQEAAWINAYGEKHSEWLKKNL